MIAEPGVGRKLQARGKKSPASVRLGVAFQAAALEVEKQKRSVGEHIHPVARSLDDDAPDGRLRKRRFEPDVRSERGQFRFEKAHRAGGPAQRGFETGAAGLKPRVVPEVGIVPVAFGDAAVDVSCVVCFPEGEPFQDRVCDLSRDVRAKESGAAVVELQDPQAGEPERAGAQKIQVAHGENLRPSFRRSVRHRGPDDGNVRVAPSRQAAFRGDDRRFLSQRQEGSEIPADVRPAPPLRFGRRGDSRQKRDRSVRGRFKRAFQKRGAFDGFARVVPARAADDRETVPSGKNPPEERFALHSDLRQQRKVGGPEGELLMQRALSFVGKKRGLRDGPGPGGCVHPRRDPHGRVGENRRSAQVQLRGVPTLGREPER